MSLACAMDAVDHWRCRVLGMTAHLLDDGGDGERLC
jgi:hypothetical protein